MRVMSRSHCVLTSHDVLLELQGVGTDHRPDRDAQFGQAVRLYMDSS